MKTIRQQIAEHSKKTADINKTFYVRRYYGEINFRLNDQSGIPIPLSVLKSASEDDDLETMLSEWWSPVDDEFLIAEHVKEAASLIADELGMFNVQTEVKMYKNLAQVRYWDFSITYKEFTGEVRIFDVRGLSNFMRDVSIAYAA